MALSKRPADKEKLLEQTSDESSTNGCCAFFARLFKPKKQGTLDDQLAALEQADAKAAAKASTTARPGSPRQA